MKTLRMLSWNVNGIRAVHKKEGFAWFFEQKPDILCIQETKAQPEQVPDELQDLDGYQVFFSSAQRKGYSGVALFTRPVPDKVERDIGIERFDSEGRVLIAHYPDFCLLNVYFPNGKASDERLQYKMDFYDAFLDYVEDLRTRQPNIVICGDVNTAHKEIDLARPKENEKISGFLPIERAWIDKFLDRGYVDSFRLFNQEPDQYTWWSMRSGARARNVGWRIDYFYVSREFQDRLADAFIWPEIMGSDHCPLGIDVNLSE